MNKENQAMRIFFFHLNSKTYMYMAHAYNWLCADVQKRNQISH